MNLPLEFAFGVNVAKIVNEINQLLKRQIITQNRKACLSTLHKLWQSKSEVHDKLKQKAPQNSSSPETKMAVLLTLQ